MLEEVGREAGGVVEVQEEGGHHGQGGEEGSG